MSCIPCMSHAAGSENIRKHNNAVESTRKPGGFARLTAGVKYKYYEVLVLKQILCYSIIISLFFASACSKSQMTAVMDDISRDTYENNARKQHIENLGNPIDEEYKTYDQYQRERKELTSDHEETSPVKR